MLVDTLKVFVTAAEQQNFSRAAELLNLSQPGISMHIRNLENELGVKLMHRSPKQVKLTEAGVILYRHAANMLQQYEQAKHEIHLLQDEVTGSIKIGASFTIGEYILPRLLAAYANQYPLVDLQVTIGNTEEIVSALRGNDLDLAWVEGKVSHPDVEVKPVMEDEMIVIAPPDHPFSSLKATIPSSLQEQVWVLREKGSGTRAFSDHMMAELGLAMKRCYVFNSSQGVKEAVAAGLGFAVVSRFVVRKELETGEISEIPIQGKQFARSLSVVENKSSPKSLAKKLFLQKVSDFAAAFKGA